MDNPNDPTQGDQGGNGGGMPAGDQPMTPPAAPTGQPTPTEDTSTPSMGGESSTGAPMQEEKCSTCGGAASSGNCTMCAQPSASCTCPPAQTGGDPAAPGM